MNLLVKKIRAACEMSQQEFAAAIGSTFASVNRWENGHHIPGRMAQDKILSLCEERQVPVYDLVLQNIQSQADAVVVPEDRKILYHGSKSGIVGAIAPCSRDRCDFGAGFYMGTDLLQPLTLICDFDEAKFYVVSLQLDGLSVLDVPADLEWAMLVAYHRGKMEKIKGTPLCQRYAELSQRNDILVGSIANDRMFFVLDNFFQGNITDTALVQSLSALQLGKQYVAKTEKGCGQVRVEHEIPLSYLEKECLKRLSQQNRAHGIALANDICKKHRREGRYFDEILDDAKNGVI
jgi:transcriptional regulator with XRE-family HTH domain